MSKVAVVLIRGLVGVRKDIKDTLAKLKLTRKNQCVIVEDKPSYMGMIKKVKDLTTWGVVDDEMIEELFSKRGRICVRTEDSKGKFKYSHYEYKGKKYLPYFNLNSPKGGFERKGIKVQYNTGGVLGNRGEKIKDLIKRMV